MIAYLRSALFLVWFAVVSILMNVGALPVLAMPQKVSLVAAKIWADLVLFGLRWIAGLRVEVRGTLPSRRVLVAAKHFTMWETIAFLTLFPSPVIVLKRSLLRVPLYGWYCQKMGVIAIDREAGARALRGMAEEAKRRLAENRPIVIFPEGTRTKPGAPPDYKPGVAGLYAQLGVPCVPVAHNAAAFWAGYFLRKPGTIVLEVLEPIPAGVPRHEFMRILESRIEEAANRLLAEGGYPGQNLPASGGEGSPRRKEEAL
jgi:1-acyl-sn-glycerol-3-phosphate acyltransferase